MPPLHQLLLAWMLGASLLAFALFGLDKLLAGRPGQRRIPELHLVLLGALGGWVGGLLGMLLFRHKTAKLSFKLKYALGLAPFVGLLYLIVLRR